VSASNRVGWWTLLFLAALGLGMAVASVAHADYSRLAERVAELVPRFGARGIELVEPVEFGNAVAQACSQDRECAARLLTMAVLESGLSAAVSRSEYRYHEGDAYTDRDGVRRHKAWGTYQLHANKLNADAWGSEDAFVQAKAARAAQAGAVAECRGYRSVAPELGMWRVLSGRGCLLPYSGEAARMALLVRIRKAL
jgi:hypothetical protein